MFEKYHGYPIEQATDEEVWKQYNQHDDDYITHNEILEAWGELIRRGLIKKPEWMK